jgi:4-amino-4-deoxy-L-arabinose transferase-like glycosyltransferase
VPVLVVTGFNLSEGRRDAWKRMFAPRNLLVFNAVVLPWFIAVTYAQRDFAYYGLVKETWHRFSRCEFRRREPFYFFGPIVAGGLMTWSLLLPEGVWTAWQTRRNWSRIARLCIVWAVTVFVGFSLLKSKQPVYILSVTVPCGILIAALLAAAERNSLGRAARTVFHGMRGLVALSLGLAATGVWLCTPFCAIGGEVGGIVVPLRPLIAVVAAVLVAVSVLAVVAARRRQAMLAFTAMLLMQMALLAAAFGAVSFAPERRSSRAIAAELSALPPDTEVVCYGHFPAGLPFYLGRSAALISDTGSELRSNYIIYKLGSAAQWPAGVVRPSEFAGWVASRRSPVYLLASERHRAFVDQVAGDRSLAVHTSAGYCGVLIPATKRK